MIIDPPVDPYNVGGWKVAIATLVENRHKFEPPAPAMAAGITDRLWSLEDIVAKIDEMTPAPAPRGPYKKRDTQ